MIAFDTNVLVYAHRAEMAFHRKAKVALERAANGQGPWVLLWPCLHEFLAVVTNPKIFKTPSPMTDALEQLDAWLSSPTVVVLNEGDGYLKVLKESLLHGRIQGAKVHDARVAALVAEHGVDALVTADRDFSRFPKISVRYLE